QTWRTYSLFFFSLPYLSVLNCFFLLVDISSVPPPQKQSVKTQFESLFKVAENGAEKVEDIDKVIREVRRLKNHIETLRVVYCKPSPSAIYLVFKREVNTTLDPTAKKENPTPQTTAESSPLSSPP